MLATWLLGAVLVMPLQAVSDQNRLVLLNWDGYLDDNLLAEFERQYDTRVIQVLFSSEEDRTSRLASVDGRGYDLIMTSGVDLSAYVKRGWIAPLDKEQLPNLVHVDTRLRQAFPYARSYALPFCWGTLGVVYRKDLVEDPITSWRQLYKPDSQLQGRFNLLEDGRDLISMGLKSLGYSANSSDMAQLKEVESLLVAQQEFVRSYHYPSLGPESELVSGELLASMAYNSDAMLLMERSEDLVYVLPEEGTNLWIDYLAIGAKSTKPELAHRFLDFLNEPEHAAQLAQRLYCATGNSSAEKLLPPSFLENPVIYPTKSQLDHSEYYKPTTGKALRKRNQISTRVLDENRL